MRRLSFLAKAKGEADHTRTRDCSECGRPMAPGAPASVVKATCIYCLAKLPIAVPRARRLIRAGAVPVDPTVRAFGRGPSKGAKRKVKAHGRDQQRQRIAVAATVARATARRADIARSTAAEAARKRREVA